MPTTRINLPAIALLATVFAACDCKPRHRVELPTGASYNDEVRRVERIAGTLEIVVPVNRLKRSSPEGQIFERLGYVRFEGARAKATGAWASRLRSNIGSNDDTIDVPIGTQRIDALTFMERDESGACTTYGSAENDVGYRAHVDRLNDLGRALLAAHLLSIGFRNDPRPWDGRSHLNGVLSVYANDDSPTPAHVERGEEIALTSDFDRFRGTLAP